MPHFNPDNLALHLGPVLVGAVCSVSCALLGCYLVLRRMSLMGDAISHAVLPGIALAFLLTGQINGWPIILGAMALGILTTFLTQAIHSLGNVPEDSSMGVVFTSLFALGVLLISNIHADLDPGCVLYGLIEFTALDTFPLLGLELPRALLTMVPVLLLTGAFLFVFRKELALTSFDPELATAMGLSAGVMHYLLMAMVAGVTVASFEAVGAILVVAMLIVPAATAQLLSDRLWTMKLCAVGVALLSSVLGYAGAAWWNTSVAGMMAVAAGLQFALAVFFAPRHGLVSKYVRNLRLSLRIAAEDVLGVLYRREEAGQGALAVAEARKVAGWLAWVALPRLRQLGEVQHGPGGTLELTEAGRHRARFLVRSHRLWETYLHRDGALPLDHLHDPAERMEHYIDPPLQEALAEQLENPRVDPHGQKIPPPAAP